MTTSTERVAGIDESGKGDFFGPLVVAAAAVGPLEMPDIDELYVRDSKKISDSRVIKIASLLRNKVPHNVVVIMPQKYNELYKKISNLNHLLAWAHARAVENLLEQVTTEKIISDKFGKEELLIKSLMEKGRQIELIQETKGERHIPVAMASIFARAEFINSMQRLSKKWQMTFPKGASNLVDQAGKEFVEKHGEEKLGEVAKLHFKNKRKIGDLIGRIL